VFPTTRAHLLRFTGRPFSAVPVAASAVLPSFASTVLIGVLLFLIFFQNRVHIAYFSVFFESHSHSLSTNI
jgi:hypothetical protein